MRARCCLPEDNLQALPDFYAGQFQHAQRERAEIRVETLGPTIDLHHNNHLTIGRSLLKFAAIRGAPYRSLA